jgi:hypothetical protein
VSARIEDPDREAAFGGRSSESGFPGAEPKPMIGKSSGDEHHRRPAVRSQTVKGEIRAVGRGDALDFIARRAPACPFARIGPMADMGRPPLAGLGLAAVGALMPAAARWDGGGPGTIVLSGKHATFVFLLLCLIVRSSDAHLSLWKR